MKTMATFPELVHKINMNVMLDRDRQQNATVVVASLPPPRPHSILFQ